MANVIHLSSFSLPELDVYARTSEAQLLNRERPRDGLFIAESPLVISRALDAGYVPVSVLVEDRHVGTQAAAVLSRCGDIPVYTAPFDVLTQITGFELTRGMLCAMRRPPLPDVADVLAGTRRIAVLENVMNPTNVGAVFRSAAALNMDAVLLTSSCSNPLYRRCIRVSMGTVFQIPWTFLPASHSDWPAMLKEFGFRTAAMALRDNSLSLRDPRLSACQKLAIAMGSEGYGLSDVSIDACDFTVKIPMSHGVDSLNVAAASAVAFWQLGCGSQP